VGIWTVFEIFGHFLLKGGMGPPHMIMTYIPSDAPWYKEQEYIVLGWSSFKDVKLVPYCAPTEPQAGAMTLTNLWLYCVWKRLCKFELYGGIGSCWEDLLNMFPL
jgi:hypothetical protein